MTVVSKKNIIKACARRSKKVFCKSTIKTGINTGFYCGRLDCNRKSHKNFGILLHYPKFIVNIIENYKYIFDHEFLISIYKKFSTTTLFDKMVYVDIIKLLLEKCMLSNIDCKIVYTIYIIKLLDTYSMNNFVNKYQKFKKTVDDKILEFQNDKNIKSDNHIKHIIYFNKNFETGKKFLSRKKNIVDFYIQDFNL